jgi:hypothetical protein
MKRNCCHWAGGIALTLALAAAGCTDAVEDGTSEATSSEAQRAAITQDPNQVWLGRCTGVLFGNGDIVAYRGDCGVTPGFRAQQLSGSSWTGARVTKVVQGPSGSDWRVAYLDGVLGVGRAKSISGRIYSNCVVDLHGYSAPNAGGSYSAQTNTGLNVVSSSPDGNEFCVAKPSPNDYGHGAIAKNGGQLAGVFKSFSGNNMCFAGLYPVTAWLQQEAAKATSARPAIRWLDFSHPDGGIPDAQVPAATDEEK